MEQDTLNKIKEEIDKFNRDSIEIVPGFRFNQKKTLEKIHLYYNSKYETGEFDNQGDKKYFYNIVRVPCNVATKAVDFDTKDIKVLTAEGGNPRKTWFFERDLKFWMKDQKFGAVLNRLFFELPIFGSVVLKIIDGKPYFVDLRNFIVDQGADDLEKSNYIIEVHNYTPVEFRKIAEEQKWDNYEEVIEKHRGGKEPLIKVYERYGELEKNGSWAFRKVIIADAGTKDAQFVLAEDEVDEIPYKEFHWEKIPGRWLGIGRVEILLDNQIRVNEISNQQVKSSQWSTLRIWQTRDAGINRNLLTDVENGEILTVDSEIQPIDMVDRNLSYYETEIRRWLTNRDEMTFAFDVLRGERLPSGTPLGSAQIAAGMAGSYFDQIRENIAMAVKDLIIDRIIPKFLSDKSKEHTLRLVGEDLDKYHEMLIDYALEKSIFDLVQRTNTYPTGKEKELLRGVIVEQLKKSKEKLETIPKNFYKDIQYKIDIDITGEAIDVRIKAANMWVALQAITADPTLLTDPAKKKLFYQYLEQGGISPVDIEPETVSPSLQETINQVPAQPTRAGGGISRPVVPQMPVAGAEEIRV
jgi:hypothetical protein